MRAFDLFSHKFNKFNNSGARILDSIYHMALKLIITQSSFPQRCNEIIA